MAGVHEAVFQDNGAYHLGKPTHPNVGPISLGYAPPSRAARIGLDGLHGRENWCEWIYSCYGCDARKALQNSIRSRHTHKGYMAEYKLAKALVDRCLETGDEPVFAAWF